MILGRSQRCDPLEIRPQIPNRRLQKKQRVIYQMRAPVVELASPAFQQGLPIPAELETMTAKFDFIDIPQDPGSYDFAQMIESSFEPAVEPEKQFAGIQSRKFQEFIALRFIQAERLFQEHEFPLRKRATGELHMLLRAYHDGYELDLRIREKCLAIGIKLRARILFEKRRPPLRKEITARNKLKKR